MNADYHAACRTSHAGRDRTVSRRRHHPQLCRHRPQGDLRAARTHPARPPVPGSVEERQGGCAPLSGQDQRTQPVANHPLDRPLARARRHRAARFPPPPLPTPLHARRYRSLGRGRRGARRPLGPGRASYSRTRIRGLRQGRLSTIGLHLGLPHLQPAAHPRLSRTPRAPHQNSRRGGEHRRAAQARSARSARLLAGRHRAPGRHRNQQGAVSHQRRRHGHAMAGGGLLRNHLRGPFEAGFRGYAASIPPSAFAVFIPTTARSFSTTGWRGCWTK